MKKYSSSFFKGQIPQHRLSGLFVCVCECVCVCLCECVYVPVCPCASSTEGSLRKTSLMSSNSSDLSVDAEGTWEWLLWYQDTHSGSFRSDVAWPLFCPFDCGFECSTEVKEKSEIVAVCSSKQWKKQYFKKQLCTQEKHKITKKWANLHSFEDLLSPSSFCCWLKCCLALFPALLSVNSSTIRDAATAAWLRMHQKHSLAKAKGRQNWSCFTVVYSNLFFGGCVIKFAHRNVCLLRPGFLLVHCPMCLECVRYWMMKTLMLLTGQTWIEVGPDTLAWIIWVLLLIVQLFSLRPSVSHSHSVFTFSASITMRIVAQKQRRRGFFTFTFTINSTFIVLIFAIKKHNIQAHKPWGTSLRC